MAKQPKISFTSDELEMIREIASMMSKTTQNDLEDDYGLTKVEKFYAKLRRIKDPDAYIPYTTPEWLK